MKRKIAFVLLAGIWLLSGCGQKEAMKSASAGEKQAGAEQATYDETLEFQRTYIPIVEEEMNKRFKPANPSDNPFERYGTYYIDNDRKKFVYLLDDEEAPAVKELVQALKARLGEHVEFKKPQHSQLELKALSDRVAKAMQDKKVIGGWGVGVDVIQGKVKVEAYLSETDRAELIRMFGSELLAFEQLSTGIGLAGYVIEKKDGQILVADPHAREDGMYAATWFSNAPSTVELGNEVEVTVVHGMRTLMMQYPDRDTALEVKVLKAEKLEGKDLAEFETVRKAVQDRIQNVMAK
ncbi:hypothetical protein [Paenibacillus montanisoli]|uniref:Lipoprotein n=1 Tax=Paenibacillus montanisoli TaxID=2081970 RepID=A0A328TVA2_9BACL|nr:hypothetical protein [Paenibacillus montanisoli]RAP73413.1 hypothetical protein DL346_27300 [Paenibacillus montanisoli]